MGDHVKVSRNIRNRASPLYSVVSESEEGPETLYDEVQVPGAPSSLTLRKSSLGLGRKYLHHYDHYREKKDDSDMDIDQIKNWMLENRIDCVKYNYSLE